MVVSYEFILFFDRLGILETLPLYFFYTFGHVLEVTHREKKQGDREVCGRVGPLWAHLWSLKVYLESARKPSDAATWLQ